MTESLAEDGDQAFIPRGYTREEALISAGKAIGNGDYRAFYDADREKFYGGFEDITVIRAATPEEKKTVEALFAESGVGDTAFEYYVDFWIKDGDNYFLARKTLVIPQNTGLFERLVAFPVAMFANYSLMGVPYKGPSEVSREGESVYQKVSEFLKERGDSETAEIVHKQMGDYLSARYRIDTESLPWSTHAPVGREEYDTYYSKTYMDAYNTAIMRHLLFSSPVLQSCTKSEPMQHHLRKRGQE